MVDIDEVFRLLAASSFRRRFRLQGRELAYLRMWGMPHVLKLAKTHGIEKGHEITSEEMRHILAVIERWLTSQLN